jgi:signal transduction histidine kinase
MLIRTLRLRMLLSLGLTQLGALVIGVGSLLAVAGLHQDLSVSVQGYRQLRQLFDAGLLASRARDCISANPPQPQQAVIALRSALATLNVRSDSASVDGPPTHWVDEAARDACGADIKRAIEQLDRGDSNTASLNRVFSQLAHTAEQVRQSIADAQTAADRRQKLARLSILLLCGGMVLITLLIGAWQYRRVIDPIHLLSAGVRAFAAGDLDRRIQFRADREFAALAADFNTMAQQLSALYRDLEAKVSEKSQQLVRSEQLATVGYLAASVAHEINNPIAIIAGYSERAIQRLDEGTDETEIARTRSALAVICEQAFRCKQITDRLLSLAKPAAQHRAMISLAETTATVVATLQGLGTEQAPAMTLEIQPQADFTVFADEGQIKQLLLNLLINALDAVDPATGKISVGLTRTQEQIRLTITDNGHGMTPATLDRIFQPFFSARKDTARGTGLGLSIAQAIAGDHNGSITAISDGPGTGSTFCLIIPPVKPEVSVAGV